MAAIAGQGSSVTFLDLIIKSPWLLPRISSVSDLVFKPLIESWLDIRTDPAAVCFLLRHSNTNQNSVFPECLESGRPVVSDLFVDLLNMGLSLESPVNCSESVINSLCRAAIAFEIARLTSKVSPDLAWVGALLFDFKGLARNHIQEKSDSSSLARQYGLPVWIRLVNQLSEKDGLQVANAAGLIPGLGEIILLADLFTNEGQVAKSAQAKDLEKKLKLSGFLEKLEVSSIVKKWFGGNIRAYLEAKRKTPENIVSQCLQFAITTCNENKLIRSRDLLESDAYKNALQNLVRSGDQRFNDLKLQSVVELAAGAGHEINNPLAVIQGQSQFILSRMDDLEFDETRDKLKYSLESIIRQAKRINIILRNLMQFARPSVPAANNIKIKDVVGTVVNRLAGWALEKKVLLTVSESELFNLSVFADLDHTRMALECLVRNSIEAAGQDGWVRLGIEAFSQRGFTFFVEDSGPGPAVEDALHLFDPFFSGRQAGRGKGLGLSVAWRLTTLNKGLIRFNFPSDSKPTRFEIVLPIDDKSGLGIDEQTANDNNNSTSKAA